MKKFLGLLLVFGMMAGVAHAINPDICLLCVTPGVTYSVNISTDVAIKNIFTGVNINGAAVSMSVSSTTNDGNVTCDFTAKANDATSGGTPWELDTGVVAANVYNLGVGFNWGWGAVEPTYTLINDDAATELPLSGGEDIASGQGKILWAIIQAPTSSTSTGEFSITLSIYAELCD
ncbi:MAG: hypothetical protein V1833_03730 [Elusimicrobiota bacterium]